MNLLFSMTKVIVVYIMTAHCHPISNYGIFKTMEKAVIGVKKFINEINKHNQKECHQPGTGKFTNIWKPEYTIISMGKIYPDFMLVLDGSNIGCKWICYSGFDNSVGSHCYFKMCHDRFFCDQENEDGRKYWNKSEIDALKVSSVFIEFIFSLFQ
jgi:hypothetical protein